MIITALMPGGGSASLGVAENTLVYDGQEFLSPDKVKYLELYTLPVQALSAKYRTPQEFLHAAVRIRALVINRDPTVVPDTDPSVVAEVDPSGGQCICGITCQGTDLRFVIVTVEL